MAKVFGKFLLKKILSLIIAGILLGFIYDWGVTRLYSAERTATFWMGIAHGALMPVALPTLLMGNDAPIFAANNNGRGYKIGYICGINLCGLFFFGMAFAKQKPEPAPTKVEVEVTRL